MNDSTDDTRDEDRQEGVPPASQPPATPDAGLSDLRARLGELQGKVELLGTQGVWHEDQPRQVPPAGPTEYTYGPPPGGVDPANPFGAAPGRYEVPRYEPDPGYGQQPTGYDPQQPGGYPPQQPPAAYGQPQQPPYQPPSYEPSFEQPFTPAPGEPVHETGPEPAAWEQPYEQPPGPAYEPAPSTYAAPPVATNGHSEDTQEVSARSTTVALVDAGPFDDLIQLRHFEDELSSLAAVRDVRVRRFGHGRASIEVGMTGPYSLSRELYRLGRQMEIADGPAGDLIITFAPSPEALAAEAEQAQPAHEDFTEGAA